MTCLGVSNPIINSQLLRSKNINNNENNKTGVDGILFSQCCWRMLFVGIASLWTIDPYSLCPPYLILWSLIMSFSLAPTRQDDITLMVHPKGDFHINFSRSSYSKNSLISNGIIFWNNLQTSIKQSLTLENFSRKIKTSFLNTYLLKILGQ